MNVVVAGSATNRVMSKRVCRKEIQIFDEKGMCMFVNY